MFDWGDFNDIELQVMWFESKYSDDLRFLADIGHELYKRHYRYNLIYDRRERSLK